jgi:uncharacterized SAM-binding protein YcdF (DUF218 family)
MFLLHLKTLIKYLFLPPAGPLLLAFAGLLIIRRRPAMGRALAFAGVATLWILSTGWAANSLQRLAERYPALDMQAAAGAQAIVILGGGGQRLYAPEYGGPAAGGILLERLSYGAFLAHKTQLPVLVTGFRVEAAAMHASLARNFGIETRWVDNSAYDTFENARNSAQLLQADGIRRILLVTHAIHMRRAVEEFRSAGLDVVPAPTGFMDPNQTGLGLQPFPDQLLRSTAAINEIVGEAVRALLQATHIRSH